MSSGYPKILFIGYGNPGRLDDGLGPALAEKIEAASLEGLTVEADYQLVVEDAVDVSKHDIVIFADAAVNGKEPFFFKEIRSRSPISLNSHSVSPEAVLFFAQKMFHARTRAYVLGIRGYEFDGYEERLSEGAVENLEKAYQFIAGFVKSDNFFKNTSTALERSEFVLRHS